MKIESKEIMLNMRGRIFKEYLKMKHLIKVRLKCFYFQQVFAVKNNDDLILKNKLNYLQNSLSKCYCHLLVIWPK